ncbi:MAG: lysozyme inhibitor LprI family protein [Prosthecobacter sp.]|uniref:lysozyme inhibitor LprI family protein n=1 Tax=Prosthecobacter sp. TaxID=1965333 RepID=UPI003902D60E
MNNTTLFLVLALAVPLTSSSLAEAKALTAKEARALFDKADRTLNEVWTAAKRALPESEFNSLKESQRAWVEHRDYLARSPQFTGADFHGELPLDSPEYLTTAAGLAEERTTWLKGLMSEATDETLTGLWSDSYGGGIEIVESGGHLHFVMTCVRGRTSHLGGLAGSAVWNQTIGWFSDKGRESGNTAEANVSFILRGRQLEVVGANTGAYHGARASFDGSYVKVQPLNAKAQAKVVKAAKSGEVPEE